MTAALDEFRESLDDLGVGIAETTRENCAGVVADLVQSPAIGVDLPEPFGRLPDSVETNLTTADLEAATTGVTPAILGIGDYGSVLLESDSAGTEAVSVYPEHHVAVVRAADVVPDMPAAFDRLGPRLREARRSIVFATGPSATADMGALVLGAHGPKAVDVVLVHDADSDDRPDPSIDEGAKDGAERR